MSSSKRVPRLRFTALLSRIALSTSYTVVLAANLLYTPLQSATRARIA
jgi:hypothetical protein